MHIEPDHGMAERGRLAAEKVHGFGADVLRAMLVERLSRDELDVDDAGFAVWWPPSLAGATSSAPASDHRPDHPTAVGASTWRSSPATAVGVRAERGAPWRGESPHW